MKSKYAEETLTIPPVINPVSDEPEPVIELEPLAESDSAELIPETEPVVYPPGAYVYDAQEADEWLGKDYRRILGKKIESVRFDPEGVNPKKLNFALYLLVAAIKPQVVLYVPVAYADYAELAELKRCEQVGDYVSFCRE